MNYTAIFHGTRRVSRVEVASIPDVQTKLMRLNEAAKAPFYAELYSGDKLVARVYPKSVAWVERPDAWAHLLADDGL